MKFLLEGLICFSVLVINIKIHLSIVLSNTYCKLYEIKSIENEVRFTHNAHIQYFNESITIRIMLINS